MKDLLLFVLVRFVVLRTSAMVNGSVGKSLLVGTFRIIPWWNFERCGGAAIAPVAEVDITIAMQSSETAGQDIVDCNMCISQLQRSKCVT